MRIRFSSVAVLLCAAVVASFAGNSAVGWAEEDWPEFRGPTGQGHSSAKHLPIVWSKTENIAWKQAIPGKGWSTPALVKGRLYLTTAVPKKDAEGEFQSLCVMCLDAADGKTIWSEELFQQRGPKALKIHGKNSHASPSPIVEGERLFVHFGTHGTACLDLNGKTIWKTQELKYAPVHGNGGSPVLVDGALIVSCDGGDVQFVAALDDKTGNLRWKKDRTTKFNRGFSFGTPLVIEVAGKKQVISQGSGGVTAFDPHDGREIWKVLYNGYSVVPRPVFGHGLLFVCTGYDSPSLLAIRPDGTGDVTETHIAWQLKKTVPHNPSPLLVGDELYIVSDGGVATCLEAKTGKQHWQKRLGGAFSASPIDAAGKIYFLNEAGEGVVIQAGTEYKELARNEFGERTLASFAATDNALFIRSEQSLARIQEKPKVARVEAK